MQPLKPRTIRIDDQSNTGIQIICNGNKLEIERLAEPEVVEPKPASVSTETSETQSEPKSKSSRKPRQKKQESQILDSPDLFGDELL